MTMTLSPIAAVFVIDIHYLANLLWATPGHFSLYYLSLVRTELVLLHFTASE